MHRTGRLLPYRTDTHSPAMGRGKTARSDDDELEFEDIDDNDDLQPSPHRIHLIVRVRVLYSCGAVPCGTGTDV